MTTHRIIVGRNQTGPSGKCYSALTEDKVASAPTAVLAVQHAFQTLEELAALLGTVVNDPTGIVILNPAIGIQDNTEFHILSSREMQTITGRDEAFLRTTPVHRHPDGRLAIARLKESFAPGTVMLLDRDVTKYTPTAFGEALGHDTWRDTLDALLPGLSTAGAVSLPSNSSRVVTLDGRARASKNGHRYVLCDRPIPGNMGSVLETQAMRAGLAWAQESKSGAKMLRTIVDCSVFVPGRWVFSGSPTSDGTVSIMRAEPTVTPGHELSLETIPDTKGYEQLARGLGIESKLRDSGHAGSDTYDLRLDELIDTQKYGMMTVREIGAAMQDGSIPEDKVRCQVTNWRPESTSWNGVIRIGADDGRIFVYDQGARQTHWLDTDGMRTILRDPYWSPDTYRINHLIDQFQIGPVAGSSEVPVNRIDTSSPGVVVPAYGVPLPPSLYPIPQAQVRRTLEDVGFVDAIPRKASWVIPGIITEGVGTLAGQRGKGKSTVLASLICHATHLKDLPGIDRGPRRKVLVISEDPPQLSKVIRAYTKLPNSVLGEWIRIIPIRREAPELLAVTLTEADRELAIADEKRPDIMRAPWIIVDTLFSAVALENYSDPSQASYAMNAITTAAKNVLLVCHFSKTDAKGGKLADGTAAGSQSWEALASQCMVFGQESGEEGDGRQLVQTKIRAKPLAHSMQFTRESIEIEVVDEYGELTCETIDTMVRDVGVQVEERVRAAEAARAIAAIEQDGEVARKRGDDLHAEGVKWIGKTTDRKKAAALVIHTISAHPDQDVDANRVRCEDNLLSSKLMTASEFKSLWNHMINVKMMDERGVVLCKIITEAAMKGRQWDRWFELVIKK